MPSSGQLQKVLVDLFFPRRCVGCGRTGEFLCPGCIRQLPRLLPPFCRRCGKPESSGGLCSACWGYRGEIEGIRSPYHFEGVIRQAIHDLKYHNLKAICSSLAQLLAVYLESNPVMADVLVPVPLSSRRLRERGYNQSALLARELGRLVALPVMEDGLYRAKDALPQARTPTLEERRKNVSGAFACRGERLSGKRVLLIDDVCTSGATLEACAVAAKSAGAASVWGLTVARET